MKKYSLSLLVVIIVVIANSFYVLKEGEQAIVIQFGKPVGETSVDAGLYFKVPLIQNVIVFEKRILEWDGASSEIPTKDNKYIYIDAYARWRISDALIFYKAAKNEMMAQSRLDDIIDGAVRDEISNRIMSEIIRSSDRNMTTYESEVDKKTDYGKGARLVIVNRILNNVKSKLVELDMGIEIIDVQLKRIQYNERVQSKLFNRMISEQNMIAEKSRAQGQGKKQEILGMQDKKQKELLSEAYVESQKIIGSADAEAIKIYAHAYTKSPEFYNFIKTLESYESSIDSTTQVILSTNNKYLKYLNQK